MISRPQAEALATFITRVRPDWRHAGIIAAIEKCQAESATDVARALVNLAEDQSLTTPALLAGPGGHWRKPDGVVPMRRGDHNVSCPEHTGHTMPCPKCKAELRPPTPDELDAARAKVDEAREAYHARMQQLRGELGKVR